MVIDLHYLPTLPFLALAQKAGVCWLEGQEHYQKRSFRNRTFIATANGLQRLSIPLQKGKNQQMPIRDVQISYNQNWQKQHWGAIVAAYSKAPFFEYYAAELETLFQQQKIWLFDWNYAILEWLAGVWSLEVAWKLTPAYVKQYPAEVLDLRGKLRPDNIAEFSREYQLEPHYAQVFQEKHGFLPNLSGLDLLFCAGPEGVLLLK